MKRLAIFLYHHELLLSVGVFGVAQMGADMLADLEWGTAAAIVRGLGILLIVGILIRSLTQRNRPTGNQSIYRTTSQIPLPRGIIPS